MLLKEYHQKLKESTDTFDYNEMMIDSMRGELEGYAHDWMKRDLMEEDDAHKVLKKYDKALAVLLKKCDKELSRLG